MARAALRLQELVVDPLQVQRAREQPDEQQRERAEHERRAQARQRERRRVALRSAAPAASAPRSSRGSACRQRDDSVRAAVGSCMRSCSRAIFSTRAGMPHVDCSSCSWPYSVSQRARLGLRALELDEEAPRLVARRHERQRARDEDGEQHEVHAGHAVGLRRSRAASRRAARAPCARRRAAPRCASADCARLRRPTASTARPTSASGAPGSASRADRQPRRRRVAGERLRRAGEEVLDDAVFERVEADHGQPAASRSKRHDAQAAPASAQTARGSRKSEGPGTSAWPDPDPNHPACARRWLAPRFAAAAACRRRARARAPPQLLLQSIEQTVLHHSRG